MRLSKPVIAAIEGYAVAGGLELAIWCDLRVAARDSSFGVFCRRWGVPLVDGGSVRLPRLIGAGRAMDLILTGREVDALEAERMGLVNWVVEPGAALDEALSVAFMLAGLPQHCLRNDRLAMLAAEGLSEEEAIRSEFRLGLDSLAGGEARVGAARFVRGAGRGGAADRPTDG
jgi:enoyl-CoA hydratase